MTFFLRSSRGQASLEFTLVLIFMMVIMAAIIVPLGQRSQNALEDVSSASFARAGLSHIDYTISNMTTIPGGSRQIIDVYLAKGMVFSCDPVANRVSLVFPLHSDVFDASGNVPSGCVDNLPPAVPTMQCTKEFVFPSTSDLHCQGDPSASFSVETGSAGFSQRFNIRSYYKTGAGSLYIIDFNAV